MRSSVVLFLVASFALFKSGCSLQCYSCPDGSSGNCGVTQACAQGQDSCLKLTSGGKTYTRCLRYSECDFMSLAVRYTLVDFDFSCCQSQLCNAHEKSLFQRFKDIFI